MLNLFLAYLSKSLIINYEISFLDAEVLEFLDPGGVVEDYVDVVGNCGVAVFLDLLRRHRIVEVGRVEQDFRAWLLTQDFVTGLRLEGQDA